MQQLREALLDPESYLRGSPPIAPARSVAPGEAGVDARQVIQHAAANTRMMAPDGLPLPAPNQSLGNQHTMLDGGAPRSTKQIPVPGLVQPTETKNNTMRIATPLGYSSRPPRRVWPVVLVIGLLLGLGGGAFAVAWFGRRPAPAIASVSTGSGSESQGSRPTVNDALRGDPVDARVAPVADAAAIAVADAHTPDKPVPDAGVAAAVIDAGVVPKDAAVTARLDAAVVTPPGTVARLSLDSSPQGASVYVGTRLVGKTPLKVDWPMSATPVKFTFKLRGYRDKLMELAVTSNTMTRADLERIPTQGTNKGSGRGSAKRDDTSLERPD
jgi:hypothetical protein